MFDNIRDLVDNIFSFIGSESLTDEEAETISEYPLEYTAELYEALKGVIEGRESVSGQGKKLKLYFIAKGVDLTPGPSTTPRSNIFIGSPL